MDRVQTLAEFLQSDHPPAASASLDQQPSDELSVAAFCRGILRSREYRQSIVDRVTLGTLPPAVELRMYDYAYGRPPDRVEHTGRDGRPIESITEVRRTVVRSQEQPQEEEGSERRQSVVH